MRISMFCCAQQIVSICGWVCNWTKWTIIIIYAAIFYYWSYWNLTSILCRNCCLQSHWIEIECAYSSCMRATEWTLASAFRTSYAKWAPPQFVLDVFELDYNYKINKALEMHPKCFHIAHKLCPAISCVFVFRYRKLVVCCILCMHSIVYVHTAVNPIK